MELAYLFDHGTKSHEAIPPQPNYTGPIPAQDNIVMFGGKEASLLEQHGLPAMVWRVSQACFEIIDGETSRVTLTLELRNKKAEREAMASGALTDA